MSLLVRNMKQHPTEQILYRLQYEYNVWEDDYVNTYPCWILCLTKHALYPTAPCKDTRSLLFRQRIYRNKRLRRKALTKWSHLSQTRTCYKAILSSYVKPHLLLAQCCFYISLSPYRSSCRILFALLCSDPPHNNPTTTRPVLIIWI